MNVDLMRDDETGFALRADPPHFVLVDVRTGDVLGRFGHRDIAIDAYEKARAEVRRDMRRGLA